MLLLVIFSRAHVEYILQREEDSGLMDAAQVKLSYLFIQYLLIKLIY